MGCYLCVTFPLAPHFSKTLSNNSHKCFPHFPKSSECRVSYEYARYGSENRKSQRKCYMFNWKDIHKYIFGRLTSMLCIPLSLRISSFAVLVFAWETRVSTARMDCGVRSSKLPEILCKSGCETRHLGHGWLADAARQPQKNAASSASCDSMKIPGWSILLILSAQRWASPFCERGFKVWKTFFNTFWYTSLLKCANSSFSAAERLVGSDGSSIYIQLCQNFFVDRQLWPTIGI